MRREIFVDLKIESFDFDEGFVLQAPRNHVLLRYLGCLGKWLFYFVIFVSLIVAFFAGGYDWFIGLLVVTGGVLWYFYEIGWRRIEYDCREETLSCLYSGWLFFFERTYEVPLDDVRVLRARIDHEDNVELEFFSEGEPFFLKFELSEFEELVERQSFVMGMAHMFGLEAYQVRHYEPGEVYLEFRPEPGGERQSIPRTVLEFLENRSFSGNMPDDRPLVPEKSTENPIDKALGDPEETLPDFLPEAYTPRVLSGTIREVEIDWNPGDQVEFRYNQPPLRMLRNGLGSAVVALVIGIVGLLLYSGIERGSTEFLFGFGALLVPALIVGGAIFYYQYRNSVEERVELDWSRDLFHRTKKGEHDIKRSLQDVEAVRVNGISYEKGRGRNYYVHVELEYPDTRILIYPQRELADYAGGPRNRLVYEQGASIAKDLAEALDCEWTWDEWGT